MNRLAAAVACLVAALALGLAGCAGPSLPPVAQTTTVVYRPWTTAVLLTASDPTLTPEALEARRPAALAYLLERGFLTSRDSVVTDVARADRILRVVVGSDGGFDVTVFAQNSGGGAVLHDVPSTTIIEPAPVLPRTFRPYPRYADPLYRDPFLDPFWPTTEFFYHRRYGEPDPSYRRYPRPTPPPVIVQPAEPPPIRPRDPPPPTDAPAPREPPPPPTPRHDREPDDRRHDDVRDQYPRPPK